MINLGKIVLKRGATPQLEVASASKAPDKTSDQPVFVLEYCGCGNIVTPRAQRLQEDDPVSKKMCFNCLLHHRKIGTVERKKGGWDSNNPRIDM